jgi:hypothetical protein
MNTQLIPQQKYLELLNVVCCYCCLCRSACRELWQYCGAVFDSGRIPIAGSQGSTVLDLTSLARQQQEGGAAGGFRVVRAGVAAESAVELLTKAFGLQQLQ